MSHPIQWLKATGNSSCLGVAGRVTAVVLAVLLSASIVGIPLVILGSMEWRRQCSGSSCSIVRTKLPLEQIQELGGRLTSLFIEKAGPQLTSNVLQEILDQSPSLTTLKVKKSDSIEWIKRLPKGLKSLHLEWVENLTQLPPLPRRLDEIILRNSLSLEKLPQLHPGLKTLDIHGCDSLRELPRLPEGLEKLICSCCRSLKTAHNIPRSVRKFESWGTNTRFTRHPVVREFLHSFNSVTFF